MGSTREASASRAEHTGRAAHAGLILLGGDERGVMPFGLGEQTVGVGLLHALMVAEGNALDELGAQMSEHGEESLR